MEHIITKHGMKYVYPGRTVLEPEKAPKLPSRKKLFADLSAAYLGVKETHQHLEGSPEDVKRALEVASRLSTGELPPLPLDLDEEALLYRLLSDTWRGAYGGTPKVLTAGKRLVTKIVKYWLASEGPLFAAQALFESWRLAPSTGGRLTRYDNAYPEDFDNAFHYLDRPLPGFAALQELRLALATAAEPVYDEVLGWARELWDEVPLQAQGALVFLLPTERGLANTIIDGLEGLTGTYWSKSSHLSLSTSMERYWPGWAAAAAWSVKDCEGFERLNRKSCWGGESAYALACHTNCPEKLTAMGLHQAVSDKVLEPAEGR